MTTVMIAGGFDPLHRGHLDHIGRAMYLAGRDGHLIVVLQSDANLIRKKGYFVLPADERRRFLWDLLNFGNWTGRTIWENISDDGTCCEALERFQPSIFAKGGDRCGPDSMPASEVELCSRLGIEIRYGVGDLLGSSSRLMEEAFERYRNRAPRPGERRCACSSCGQGGVAAGERHDSTGPSCPICKHRVDDLCARLKQAPAEAWSQCGGLYWTAMEGRETPGSPFLPLQRPGK